MDALNAFLDLTDTDTSDEEDSFEENLLIHSAIVQKSSETVIALIEGGGDIDEKNSKGETPLHIAAKLDNENVMQILINAGADVNVKNGKGHTVLQILLQSYLHKQFCSMSHANLIRIFIERGADKLTAVERKFSILHAAARKGDVMLAKYLLDSGVDVDILDEGGKTPLFIALGKVMVEFLLNNNADVNKRNKMSVTPFMNQMYEHKTEVIDLFIKYGANIFDRDYEGRNALHWAVNGDSFITKDFTAIEILLKMGFDVNDKDKYHRTPLFSAVRVDDIKLMEFLVSHGAKINDVNIHGDNLLLDKIKNINEYYDSDLIDEEFDESIKKNFGETMTFLLMFKEIADSVNADGGEILKKKLPERMIKVILKSVALAFVRFNIPMSAEFYRTISGKSSVKKYFDKRNEELLRAKDTILYGKVSFFDILNANSKDLMRFGQSKELIAAFRKRKCMKNFPVYGKCIALNIKKAADHEPSVLEVKNNLRYYCKYMINLPMLQNLEKGAMFQ